jgi:hypothetical protein
MRNETKTCEKFMLFVSQKEAKIMRNGLSFASISHGAKTKFKRKRDTLLSIPSHTVPYNKNFRSTLFSSNSSK